VSKKDLNSHKSSVNQKERNKQRKKKEKGTKENYEQEIKLITKRKLQTINSQNKA